MGGGINFEGKSGVEKYLFVVSSIKKISWSQRLTTEFQRPNDVSDPLGKNSLDRTPTALLECRFFFSLPWTITYTFSFTTWNSGINIQLAQNSISFEVFRYIHSAVGIRHENSGILPESEREESFRLKDKKS